MLCNSEKCPLNLVEFLFYFRTGTGLLERIRSVIFEQPEGEDVRHPVACLSIVTALMGPIFAGSTISQPQFVKFDYPGQPSTVLVAINASGQIAGIAPGSQRSFLTDTSGMVGPSFQYPGATLSTYATGIDSAGEVIGTAQGFALPGPGGTIVTVFLRLSAGTLTSVPLPPGLTYVSGVEISGNGSIALAANQSIFFRNGNGSYTSIVVPGGGNAYVTGIDNAANVVGFTIGSSAGSFFRDPSGNFQAISVPGSLYTGVQGMNNLRQAVGTYSDAKGQHGFLWRGGSNYATLDFPGATNTFASGINDSGIIVGFFDDSITRHGMIYFPAGVPVPPPLPAAPLPPTLVLTATGLVVLLGYKIRRRKRVVSFPV